MLSQLTDVKMKAAGIDDKDLRRSALAAFRKAGYKTSPNSKQANASQRELVLAVDQDSEAGPSTVQIIVSLLVHCRDIQFLSIKYTTRQLQPRKNGKEKTI